MEKNPTSPLSIADGSKGKDYTGYKPEKGQSVEDFLKEEEMCNQEYLKKWWEIDFPVILRTMKDNLSHPSWKDHITKYTNMTLPASEGKSEPIDQSDKDDASKDDANETPIEGKEDELYIKEGSVIIPNGLSQDKFKQVLESVKMTMSEWLSTITTKEMADRIKTINPDFIELMDTVIDKLSNENSEVDLVAEKKKSVIGDSTAAQDLFTSSDKPHDDPIDPKPTGFYKEKPTKKPTLKFMPF